MSDYLGHLLERSFTPEPAVRPQAPSLFEPKRAGESIELPSDFSAKNPPSLDEKSGKAPSVGHSAESIPRPSKPVVVGDSAPGPKRPGENKNPTREAAAPIDFVEAGKKRETRPAATSTVKPIVSSSQPNQTAFGPVRTPARSETPELVPSEVRLPARRDDKIMSPVVVDFHLDDPQRQPGDRRPRATSESVQTLQPRVQPVAPEDAKPTRPLIPRISPPATDTPSREKVDPRNDSHVLVAPALPPSINVTIGRVEIRATPPPAPAVRHAPRKESGMSLETYLQRRSGGSS